MDTKLGQHKLYFEIFCPRIPNVFHCKGNIMFPNNFSYIDILILTHEMSIGTSC